jgi:hypothetical protein
MSSPNFPVKLIIWAKRPKPFLRLVLGLAAELECLNHLKWNAGMSGPCVRHARAMKLRSLVMDNQVMQKQIRIFTAALLLILLAGPVHAEKAKAPAPKDDPCANSKMKSACKNSEATRALLRTVPPDQSKNGARKSSGAPLAK